MILFQEIQYQENHLLHLVYNKSLVIVSFAEVSFIGIRKNIQIKKKIKLIFPFLCTTQYSNMVGAKKLINQPENVVEELIEGLVAAHSM